MKKKTFQHDSLIPLFEEPSNDSWRGDNPGEEVVQSLRQYQHNASINRPAGRRRAIYLQPLGDFAPVQARVLHASEEALQAFFQLPVKIAEAWPSSCIPDSHWRTSPLRGEEWPQANGEYLLDEVLIPKLPRDAVVVMAMTAFDLWDGDYCNYVFGLGSLESKVAVTSLWRLGDFQSAEGSQEDICRLVKTVLHEVAHAFSLEHCIEYRCCMNGSNNARESDAQPMELCPSCLRKLQWNIGFDPLRHLVEMQAVCSGWGFAEAAEKYEALICAATDICTRVGESEFFISAHGDTNFSHSQFLLKDEWIYGTLDNFVGVKAVMDACFMGSLNGARVEITHGEESGMAGAREVAMTVNPEDMAVVVDVTGYQSAKDLVIEHCHSPWTYEFITQAFAGATFTYEIFSDSGDPVCQFDETSIYIQRTERCFLLAIPCDGGDYNSHSVRCRRQSIAAATNALGLLFAHFVKIGRPGLG